MPDHHEINIWFMYDCHLFARIDANVSDEQLRQRIHALFKEDGCGSVFTRDNNDKAIVPRICLMGHALAGGTWGVNDDEVTEFIRKVRAYQSVDPYTECG